MLKSKKPLLGDDFENYELDFVKNRHLTKKGSGSAVVVKASDREGRPVWLKLLVLSCLLDGREVTMPVGYEIEDQPGGDYLEPALVRPIRATHEGDAHGQQGQAVAGFYSVVIDVNGILSVYHVRTVSTL